MISISCWSTITKRPIHKRYPESLQVLVAYNRKGKHMTPIYSAHVKKCILLLLFACVFIASPSAFFPTFANDTATSTTENIAAENSLPANGKLDASATRKIMDKYGSDLLIIDVRTDKEFAQGHIPEAVRITLNVFSRSLGQIPTDKPILLVCRSGARSERAFTILRGARPTQEHMWFFDGYPQYGEDNYFELNDRERSRR